MLDKANEPSNPETCMKTKAWFGACYMLFSDQAVSLRSVVPVYKAMRQPNPSSELTALLEDKVPFAGKACAQMFVASFCSLMTHWSTRRRNNIHELATEAISYAGNAMDVLVATALNDADAAGQYGYPSFAEYCSSTPRMHQLHPIARLALWVDAVFVKRGDQQSLKEVRSKLDLLRSLQLVDQVRDVCRWQVLLVCHCS